MIAIRPTAHLQISTRRPIRGQASALYVASSSFDPWRIVSSRWTRGNDGAVHYSETPARTFFTRSDCDEDATHRIPLGTGSRPYLPRGHLLLNVRVWRWWWRRWRRWRRRRRRRRRRFISSPVHHPTVHFSPEVAMWITKIRASKGACVGGPDTREWGQREGPLSVRRQQ